MKDYIADMVTLEGFCDFVFEMDRFVVENFDSKWPPEEQVCLSQQKTIDERKRSGNSRQGWAYAQ